MVGHLKLVACLFACTATLCFFGAAVSENAGRGPWPGAVGGGRAGLYLGLVAGGASRGGKLMDVLFPPDADGASESG